MADGKSEWAERAGAELRGRALDDLTWETPEGISVQPVYGPDDVEGLAHMGAMPGR